MAEPLAPEALADLVRRVEAGDAPAMAALRQLFDDAPALWQQLGDLARHAEQGLIAHVGRESVVTAEALGRKLPALRHELGADEATPLERLLIDRLVLTWAQAHVADVDALRAGRLPPAQASFYLNQQNKANQRFLASVRTLATVRKLLRPSPSPVQVANKLDDRDRVPAAIARRGKTPAPSAMN